MKTSSFIIAAPTSNSGKTTVTLGLLRLLKNKGYTTQPFKSGPDYIDPKFHKIACGKTGINLDLFMMREEHLKSTYHELANKVDISCIEGVMGLFDGARKSEGSTAELAKKLDVPIIFVVDAKSVAYSVAPLLYGFKNFDPDLNIAGVIFNRVNTKSHYKFLEEACDDVGIKALGHVPFIEECKIPSRHLGLSIDNLSKYDQMIGKMADQMNETIAIDQLLSITQKEKTILEIEEEMSNSDFKISVAQDEGFNFSYYQNIDALKQLGTVKFFSPIHDQELPDSDLVYFPGGYPECYTQELSSNTNMRDSIKNYAENGGQIIAECGGMMYLGKSMIDQKGNEWSMVGVFPFTSSMKKMKLTLGYRKIDMHDFTIKGHEFHYSKVHDDENVETIGTVWSAREQEVPTKIYQHNTVLASYIHFYFGEVGDLQQLLHHLQNNHVSSVKR
ncbi:cobyrinate a,c-diamide synthase [Flammeovirga agarivorans]|uniref:Cobyrinate a,c-diamide synthase n=1 Tax=Flammeovirga agarivorans TaxID=2726742 RepID=A0A7X8SMP8_9BACT|nr:cobyrinate a,c-diamide synthase [Flammeovirga agarivorans]NLR92996.1 cobyrinate a,c-diamide synthase [Flammeovirga agarivorans]